ncbi:type I restriction enzyme HsdR N-terminal domain-containing protein, partial [Endozoicomonas sp. SESOKO1]|uniref:type I restriction enzyme HsdR N-terminal domain-containing protein n=1 Tax=Endozoicomonas sp. SESOKO1 TaxID=2828742 RepID=UPI0021478BD9
MVFFAALAAWFNKSIQRTTLDAPPLMQALCFFLATRSIIIIFHMLIDKEFSIKESLLLYKGLDPLDSSNILELQRIQSLNVSGFTEADVRAEIIDPIIQILGYRKGQFSSVDRERHIRFLGKTHKYIDYSFTLWQENFWLIEAKRPLRGESFGYSELSQAIEYSIHPEINASVIVLCDGVKLELFDREENLEEPIISFKIENLVENIDLLRKMLS